MNKLSIALLLFAACFAAANFGADEFNDNVFDVFTEDEGLVQTPASDLKKANAAAAAAQKAANKKTNKLHHKLLKKVVSSKSTKKAAAASKARSKHASFQGRMVSHFTRIAKIQAKKNKYLRFKQRQAANSAARNLSRNHLSMVRAEASLVKTLSKVAASQRKMLARKAKAAKTFANQIKAVQAANKTAKKKSMKRLRLAKARLAHIARKIKFNKRLAKDIQKKWAGAKLKSAEKSRKINHRFKVRQARLAKQNARNLKNYNRDVAKGQAKFAAAAKSNKQKAAMAAARLKLEAAINVIKEKSTKRRAAKLNKKELKLKASKKSKELKLKSALKKKQSESRFKEKTHKAKVSAEADTKFKRKTAHAAAMEKKAKKAKADAAASVKAAKAATAAAKKAEATQFKLDAGIKECNSSTECLLNGKKCQKTGKKTGWYLDQVGFVKCVKTKPQNMIGDWAGTPFKETDFPEATYHEPKFVMPVMPGFTWKISNHFEKVKAKIKAGIKKASKNDTK